MSREDLDKINSFLVFTLGGEEFAAYAGNVLHVMEVVPITEVPCGPSYMKGVVTIRRGTVIPVVDTRMKFGFPRAEFGTSSCIIVLEVGFGANKIEIGALVDGVHAVVNFEKDRVKPPPPVTRDKTGDFVTGVAMYNHKRVTLIDIDRVFSVEEIRSLRSASMERQEAREMSYER